MREKIEILENLMHHHGKEIEGAVSPMLRNKLNASNTEFAAIGRTTRNNSVTTDPFKAK